MTGVFLKVLELSLVGSYVMIFVLAVRLLLHICKAPRWSSYLLWGIVFLRLMLPVVPDSDFSLVPKGGELPQSLVAEVQENTALESTGQVNVPGLGNDWYEAEKNDDISSDMEQRPVNVYPSTSEGDKTLSALHGAVQQVEASKNSNEANKSLDDEAFLQGLAYLWLAGVIGIGGYHLVSYHKFKASLKDVVPVGDGIYEIPGRHVSFVLGIIKPAIYISESLDADTRKVVLCHERVHLQRKDYLTKPLALAVACVHWFNPLVWLAFYLMNKDCEMSCDEKVVSILGEEGKKLYSYALLDEAAKGERQKCKRENTCTVLSFGEDSIKARIKHVLYFKKAPVWLIAGTVVIVVLLAIGLLSNRKEKEHLEMVSHHSVNTLAELKEAYVRAEDDINGNLERMGNKDCRWYDWTDNTGYDKEFMQSIFYHVANNTNPEYYDVYKDPVSAAKIMLHLGAGTGEVTEILHRTESQRTRGEDTDGVLGEGSVVNVMYVFAEDGSSVQIPMVLAEESMGIWALSAGDMTKEHKYTRGALMADAQFLAREVLEEIEAEDGVYYQISDYGIYKVSEETFQCVYFQDMSKVLYEAAYDNGERYLYYPINSQYQEGAFDTTFDSLCKVKLSTGEVCEAYSFPFEAAGRLAGEKGYFVVYGGFITLNNMPGGNNTYVLTDAGKVWNGKTTAELTEKEKNAYGVSNREYLLSHPGEAVALGNRYASQTEAFIDMDGDGKTEQIAIGKGETIGQYWKYDRYVLKLDDWEEQRYANRLHNQIWAISPDGTRIFLVLYEEGPSADDSITFLKKEEGKLVEAGSIGIAINQLEMEDGIITAWKGAELIQSDFVTTQYAFDEQGNLVEIPQEVYDYAYYRAEEGNRLLKEMTLYTEPGGEESFTLQPQNVFFEKVDGSMKWILLRAKNGQTGWFEVTGLFEIYGSPSSEWFEGLGFAG